MLTDVVVLAGDGVAPFELGLLCEAFGMDRTADGVPSVDFAVCSPGARPVRTSGGFSLTPDHDLDRAASADLVAVPAWHWGAGNGPDPELTAAAPVIEVLRAAHERGATILSVCTGAFTLGAAGLLDDRECTTHWMRTAELAKRFPRAHVVPEVLYVDTGQVVTSAGTAAGIDACLHLWRRAYGADVASTVARRMVVAPQREGGQAQFIARPVPACDAATLSPLLTWIVENLHRELDVHALASRSLMSPRTFARRFRAETGTTPHAWITSQRLLRAEQLLERTDHAVERIAQEVGFGNAATLRHHLQRSRGLTPQAYRKRFAC